jgi:hypothetical protein
MQVSWGTYEWLIGPPPGFPARARMSANQNLKL